MIYGNLTPDQREALKRELIEGIHAKDVLAQQSLGAVAKLNARPRTWRDDMRVTMQMPAHVALAWKQREGKDVLHDSGWQRYMRKHFPEIFVETKSPKIQVGYSGVRGKRGRWALA